ncbi:MAG: hypothetical protein JWP87_2009 [Labilithrix sp.]|nr:hypothetical protein [Labilithrix sp.]
MRLGLALLTTSALGIALAIAAPEAHACGGCFPPPGENQSVVTDHRMILSVSKQQTTLYDQIRYSGSPSSFAWVLPISGTVDVGLSADTLFAGLENLTTTVVQAPPDHCPPPPNCGYYGAEDGAAYSPSAGGSSGGTGGAGSPEPPPVTVIKAETIGPYDTVQLRSTDANALQNWLAQNGFAIPEDIKPVIAAYVGEHFDFLALKLVPGQGVQAMRPVRITSQGASAVLPLRMVAAGTGAVVGVSLWVVAEGRYEPQNFPFFSIKDEDLVWEWATSTSNYKELRSTRSAALNGRGWEIETALSIDRFQLESIVTNIGRVNQAVGSDYANIEKDGQLLKSAEQVRQEDLAALWTGIAPGQDHITRLRSDLAHTALTTDLALIASADQTALAQVRQPKGEKGQPNCTVWEGCRSVGTAPRDEAIARSDASGSSKGESFACATANRRTSHTSTDFATFGGLAAFLGLALVRARRARKPIL